MWLTGKGSMLDEGCRHPSRKIRAGTVVDDLTAGCFDDVRDQPGGCRLAVGAGHDNRSIG